MTNASNDGTNAFDVMNVCDEITRRDGVRRNFRVKGSRVNAP